MGHLTDQDYTTVWRNTTVAENGRGTELNKRDKQYLWDNISRTRLVSRVWRAQRDTSTGASSRVLTGDISHAQNIHNATYWSLSPWRKPALWMMRCSGLTEITLGSSSVRVLWSNRTDLPGVLCYWANKISRSLYGVGYRGFVRRAFREDI